MLAASRPHARKALCTVHGFVRQKKGPEGAVEIVRRHGCIQQDPIDVAGRNADLTLQSRILDYRREYLQELLYGRRLLFEYFCKMMSILPVETFPLFKRKMRHFEKRVAPFLAKHKRQTRLILKAAERNPISSRELTEFGTMEWGWGRSARLSNVLLTRLWISGRLMIHHREGAQKYYVPTEQVIPRHLLGLAAPREGQDALGIARLIISSSRLVSPSRAPEQWWEVGKTSEVRRILGMLERSGDIFSLKIEGIREELYAPAEDEALWMDPSHVEDDVVRFLAPLDPLLWNRHLFNTIYETDYIWEVYKKPHERKYGYYCLPILYKGDVVGFMDPFFQRGQKVLEVRNCVVFENRIEKQEFRDAFALEIERFLGYLGGEKLKVRKGKKWFPQLRN